MERLLVFLLLLFSVIDKSMQNTINKPSEFWICTGLKQGTQIPHPELCSSYFVCNNGYPDIVTCEGDLHYDRRFKVCNWKEDANCKLGEYPPHWNTSDIIKLPTTKLIPSFKTTIKPDLPKISSAIPEITTEINCITEKPSTEKPSNSTTGAKDDKGNSINPLDKYNPLNVQCYHNGLYFLPHPAKCDKYFICSNHILYLHQCGFGTNWNYENEQCELRQNFKCYYYDQIVNKSTTRKRKSTSTTKIHKPPSPEPTTINPRTTLNVQGPEIYTTEKQSTVEVEKVPECPSKQQKFLPHPTDCTKYYICIAGMPALTTCPNGMYWDEREEWCGYPEFTYCKAASIKRPVRKLKN